MEKQTKFTLTYKVKEILPLVKKTDKRILAKWAYDCVERVLSYFEKTSKDKRPRKALQTLKKWLKDGIFKMKDVRKASLDSHAAAREIKEDTPAKSAARAAGQAIATTHVKTHSVAAAQYALQAIYRKTNSMKEVEKERQWQLQYLKKLI